MLNPVGIFGATAPRKLLGVGGTGAGAGVGEGTGVGTGAGAGSGGTPPARTTMTSLVSCNSPEEAMTKTRPGAHARTLPI